MKTDTLFDLIETAQDKLGAVMDGNHTEGDLIIIRDALIEANKMRIALNRISSFLEDEKTYINKLYVIDQAREISNKALQLIEYTPKFSVNQRVKKYIDHSHKSYGFIKGTIIESYQGSDFNILYKVQFDDATVMSGLKRYQLDALDTYTNKETT